MPGVSGAVFVDSDPQGARIFIDDVDTGLRTPSNLDDVDEGARSLHLELDTAGFTYSADLVVRIGSDEESDVLLPLGIRCEDQDCLSRNAEFHAPGNARFAVNAAGPLFAHDGIDESIVWPASTGNSYAARGAATFTAVVDEQPIALGSRNVGSIRNYWIGRPVPVTGGTPYSVRVPSWIKPPETFDPTRLRGLEVVQQVVVRTDRPDVIEVVLTWRNITADSLYRLIDPNLPTEGLTFTDAWIGFILDPDIGTVEEAFDDLPSYSPDQNLVFAYDSDFSVEGFAGGWSDRPALVGLQMLAGPAGTAIRLNTWPRARDFVSGLLDAQGRLLLTAEQSQPVNHPDERIGFAPDVFEDDYLMSVAAGPVTLEPGDAVTARIAVLLAAPATGTFVPGELQPAGDPLDDGRPLAAIAAPLIQLADELLGQP